MPHETKCFECLTLLDIENENVFCELCMLERDEKIEQLKNEIKELKKQLKLKENEGE